MSCRIVLDGVSKAYPAPRRRAGLAAALGARAGEIRALDGVSLAIGEGERVGIIGRNGAGKTTLLQLVAGLATPTRGTVRVEGRVHAVMTLGAVLRDEATGRENILIDAEVQGRRRGEAAPLVERIIAFSGLGEVIDLPVRTYSSGMKARLAFSMAAFIEPQILIIDEVLSVGDAAFSRKAGARLRELAQAGRIVLLAAHGLDGIVETCSRCLWLEAGRVVMDGEPARVAAAYEESVRAAEERALRRLFDAEPPLPAGRDSARLGPLALEHAGGGGVVLAPGRDATLRLAGSGAALARPDLRLRIVRLDGVLIDERRYSERHEAARLRGPFALEIAMRPLVLGPGVYRVEAALLDGEAAVAGRSLVFEVRSEAALPGGVPMLIHPSRLTVRPPDEAVRA